ncbi:hypothetical protein CRG98_047578, partial [Punica granatum]
VLFVCTANVVETIPNPLLDRMEVIAIAGYITDEKVHIARDYLEKSTQEACGIKPEQVEVTDAALLALIENYCREAGVRNLQKQIEKIYRKIALQLVRQGEQKTVPANAEGEGVGLTEAKVEPDEDSSPRRSEGDSQNIADKVETSSSVDETSVASLEVEQVQQPSDQSTELK